MSTPTVQPSPLPRWVRDLRRLLPIRSQFVMAGNVRDVFLLPARDSTSSAVMPILPGLWNTLSGMGYEFMVVYDRVDGIRLHPSNEQTIKRAEAFLNIKFENGKHALSLNGLAIVIRSATHAKVKEGMPALRIAVVIDYAARIAVHSDDLSAAEHEFFVSCEKFSDTAIQMLSGTPNGVPLFNPVIWLVNQLEDLPSWYLIGNERIHTIVVERPDTDTRKAASITLLSKFADDAAPGAVEAAMDTFANLTEGMSLRSMVAITQLARSEGILLSAFGDAVRLFKVGLPDNPWKKDSVREKIGSATQVLGHRVKGQAQAIQKTVDILMRSVGGLTGAHSASTSSSRPRGVLFFAGPTGVGKTELAKALTEVIFGDERAYIRFDMSEFAAEHADARLLGAPPGYVGYSAGGELTNAIRDRPFSVVLFDEIEKAHPRILDKFLQILEDGRLTDGRGETVYFSETLLIFTSNLGIFTKDESGELQRNIKPGDDYEKVSSEIRNGIANHFNFALNRPELLNRFGDNIVVFDFIARDIGQQILDGMVRNVCSRVLSEHGMEMQLSNAAKETLSTLCLSDLEHGGRGIGNKLETAFVNPLARALFGRTSRGSEVTVSDIVRDRATSSFTLHLS